MTVPFEGGATPPQNPEMLTAGGVTEHYLTMVTEKLGDNWTSKRPNGTRIAELGFMVPGYPYIEAPVTIYDNGKDQTRPALEIDVPDGIKEIESGVVIFGRDGVITKQSIDMVTKKPFTKELTDSDVAVLTTLLSRNTLWPRARDTRNYPGVMLGSYNHHATHKPGGEYQWDERLPRPGLLNTEKSGLLERMLSEIKLNNRLGEELHEWQIEAEPDGTESIIEGMHLGTDPFKRSYSFKGLGDDRIIDQVYITKPSDFPVNSAPGYTGSFGSDHLPIDTPLSPWATKHYDTSGSESVIYPELAELARQRWSQMPDFPTRQEASGNAVNVFIPEEMFRRTEEPAAEPEKQNPEDK